MNPDARFKLPEMRQIARHGPQQFPVTGDQFKSPTVTKSGEIDIVEVLTRLGREPVVVPPVPDHKARDRPQKGEEPEAELEQGDSVDDDDGPSPESAQATSDSTDPPDQDARVTPALQMTIAVRQETSGSDALLVQARVPSDRLLPGPRSHRFHLVDIDIANGDAERPIEFSHANDEEPGKDDHWIYRDEFTSMPWSELKFDAGFRAQQLYAVAARTLGLFELHLGRRVPWPFESPQLFLVPKGFQDVNAYYSRDHKAIVCSYLPATPDHDPLYTCLSHDVVAHEVTHAILDGLRPRLIEPGLPDQAAFHEGLADIVALLMVASFEQALERFVFPDAGDRIPSELCSASALREGELFALAPALFSRVDEADESKVRKSILLEPNAEWIDDPDWRLPHRRAEILVAAVLHTFVDVWAKRLTPFDRGDGVDRLVFNREGAKAAGHVLGMCIRALDWLPPVDVDFHDYLQAIIAADLQLVPEDKHDYRASFETSFAAFGIRLEDEDLGRSSGREIFNDQINVHALRNDPEESARFIWHNAHALNIDLRYQTDIDRVVRSVRTGPDGLVIESVHVDYSQRASVPLKDVEQWAEHLDASAIAPEGIFRQGPKDLTVDLWGGGVLIFDQFAQLHTHLAKSISDVGRHQERLTHLSHIGRLGDRTANIAELLGEMHGQTTDRSEQW